MKPFKQIEETKKVIKDLKYNHQFIKDKSRKIKSAKRINTLIETVEMFEALMIGKYKTDAVDKLIYSLIYEWFLMFGVGEGKEIPLNYMINAIDLGLANDSNYKKYEVLDLLKSHTLTNLAESGKIKDWDFKYPPYEALLKRFLNEFKSGLRWTK